MPVREQPSNLPMSSLPTLEKALHFGRMTRLDTTRVRAALAMADRTNVIDVRSVTTMVLDRVSQYYDVVGYCAPRASFSKSESELPRAISADSEAIASNGGRPMHARAGLDTDLTEENVERLWKFAGMISLNLAFNMGEWEITRCAPESAAIVSVATKFAYRICQSPEWTGSPWVNIRRRIGSPAVRRILKSARSAISDRWLVIHPQTGHPILMEEQEYRDAEPSLRARARQFDTELRVSPPVNVIDQAILEVAEAA